MHILDTRQSRELTLFFSLIFLYLNRDQNHAVYVRRSDLACQEECGGCMEFGPCFLWWFGQLGGSAAVAEQSTSFVASRAEGVIFVRSGVLA